MPETPDGQADPAAAVAAATGQEPARKPDGRSRMAKLDDKKLQLANIVVALLALGVAIVAVVSANSASSRANSAAANADKAMARANNLVESADSAQLRLAALPGYRPGPAADKVSLDLTNQGGGAANAITASLGTLHNIRNVSFSHTCPPPVHSYRFYFPLGTTLGPDEPLSGTARVPRDAVPPGRTPTNSMALYVSWQNTDGSRQVNCLNLSNHSKLGNLARLVP
jgi:hypothetical protein